MEITPTLRRLAVAGAGLVLAAAAGSAVALAAVPSSPVYKACLGSTSHALYNVRINPSSGPNCRQGDTRIGWNQTGPQGPAGPEGPAGGATDIRSVIFSYTATNGALIIVPCPVGYLLTGGGVDPLAGIEQSTPDDANSDGRYDGWRVSIDSPPTATTYRISAICAGPPA
jgi:hypothetical protein